MAPSFEGDERCWKAPPPRCDADAIVACLYMVGRTRPSTNATSVVNQARRHEQTFDALDPHSGRRDTVDRPLADDTVSWADSPDRPPGPGTG